MEVKSVQGLPVETLLLDLLVLQLMGLNKRKLNLIIEIVIEDFSLPLSSKKIHRMCITYNTVNGR
jgi:hypothetical protein